MAFRLKNGTSIGAQLSRIVAKELRTAIDEVKHASTTAKSVHETRKHIKKIRSVLHLFRKELGSYYKALDERIRFAARQLSDVRDAETLVTTMETLRREHGRLVTAPIFKAADSVLKTRRDDSVRASWTTASRGRQAAARPFAARRSSADPCGHHRPHDA